MRPGAAEGLYLAHEKIFAGEQKYTRQRVHKSRPCGPVPEVELGAGRKLFLQAAVVGAVKAQVEGQGQGQQAHVVVLCLPVGQLAQGFIHVTGGDKLHSLAVLWKQSGNGAAKLLYFNFFFHNGHRACTALKQELQGMPHATAEENRQGIAQLFIR